MFFSVVKTYYKNMQKTLKNPATNSESPRIYLMPTPLGIDSVPQMMSPVFTELIGNIKFWVVENVRTQRRFISSLRMGIDIDFLEFFELSRGFKPRDLAEFLTKNIQKGNIGMSSEAGIPGMADPGAEVASWAHAQNVEVVPISGPSSVYLTLSASGLNGQQYSFHGYPPVKGEEMRHYIEELKLVLPKGYTQLYIETPYRSDSFFKALLTLPGNYRLCLGVGIHEEDGFIKTQAISKWREEGLVIGKRPCVFAVGI